MLEMLSIAWSSLLIVAIIGRRCPSTESERLVDEDCTHYLLLYLTYLSPLLQEIADEERTHELRLGFL